MQKEANAQIERAISNAGRKKKFVDFPKKTSFDQSNQQDEQQQ